MSFYYEYKKKSSNCEHTKKCKSCGSKDSACSCNFTNHTSMAPVNSTCTLVNSVVCSKMVQKVAEITLPITAFAGLGVLDDIVSINVVPNLSEITQNARIIQDKVVNIGLVPATITISVLGIAPIILNTSLPFQAHTDCPGACPQDVLQETPLEVEGIFVQPGVPVLDAAGITLIEGILFKIILRTTATVTRPIIVDQNGNTCDVNPNRCQTPTTPPTFTLPSGPGTTLF
ncbi:MULTISPECIES: hypothetical protein [unclassified Sutcliffiella]|uniref:hypothetical protein n=1 Tax=unclassified Sutcliffiella TaxID=2837532 RepID=UPI0030D19C67